ncbi:hypothetical protein O0L34_g1512 [Tuta absoluta]|nr:hypothetical protein O0L34_g1512 [Tuta absoluta]
MFALWAFKGHTVHPAPASSANKQARPDLSILTKGPYGSWCTPQGTPDHAKSVPFDSVLESKSSSSENDRTIIHARRDPFQPQKVRLYSSSPTHDIKYIDDDDEIICVQTEEVKKAKAVEKEIIEKPSPEPDKSFPHIETPQSPVPTTPDRKKIKWLIIPAWCDPFLPIDPAGRVYISWLFLVTFCYSYNAWCIPLRVTFPYQTLENTPHWMVFDYLCDFVYLLDVGFVKPRLMFLHEGFWVDDPGETRKNYRRKLQYKFDVVSLLPLDLLYFYFGPQRVILRFPRMLKLQTFWEFHQAVDRILASPYVVRIGKMLFYIFYLIHLNACAYYAMSDYIGLGSNEFVYDNKGNAYIRCFYFATKTATSIGKNPKPENTEEYLFMTAAWLMGVFVFAILIGQIRDIIATATRAKTEYRKKVDGCQQFMRRLNIPAALQKRVTAWFNYTWSQQRCFDESKILNALPYNMKRDVALAVHMTTLSKVQLFRDCSDSLLRDLVLQLRPVSFLPHDVVVRRGEVGHDMYIIKSGECWVLSPDEKEILATLKEGSVFGEISLLGIDGLRRRTATVRSRGYSTLFCLSRNDLDSALKHHKEAAQILRLRADQIIKENAARQAKQRIKQEVISRKPSQDEGSILRQRRPSTASPMFAQRCRSASTPTASPIVQRCRSASASVRSKGHLPTVSEDNVDKRPHSAQQSPLPGCSGQRSPLPTPTIVFTNDTDSDSD